jgi:nucleotide-binding universal stress UspA family protein
MVNQNPHVDPPPSPTVGAATAVVLVGVDGSESSWGALCWACGEAQRLRGRVLAALVSSSADLGIAAAGSALVGFSEAEGGSDLAGTERAQALGHELQSYAADHDLDLTVVHAHGNAASELVRLAVAHHADLIVIGRSTKARHHLPGSLGRRLVDKKEAPVVVVVPLADSTDPIAPRVSASANAARVSLLRQHWLCPNLSMSGFDGQSGCANWAGIWKASPKAISRVPVPEVMM